MNQKVRIRRKGVALVETEKGILLVLDKGKKYYSLPGGEAHPKETRKDACKRELEEETGMIAHSARYFDAYLGPVWNNKPIRNDTKVFVVEATGHPQPKSEIAQSPGGRRDAI
ncbi:NUDIX domain-containing protein [Oceanispirochaeta crateris]|uniref:NUDIX domain-containing protein n=1 Tax=Oceanispirochaeta crateris TaxID=2518645 RepID=A0A5C1QLC9_9SPIO|nr:NUDIX domain-containing protein [Oceanispirochaeta crateris]QEN07336.1 NUDIX domain-containing protein [Oceanispirochaeta crateris]